jgi:hypothetical protein
MSLNNALKRAHPSVAPNCVAAVGPARHLCRHALYYYPGEGCQILPTFPDETAGPPTFRYMCRHPKSDLTRAAAANGSKALIRKVFNNAPQEP